VVQQETGNVKMKTTEELLKESVLTAPLALLSLKEPAHIQYVNSLLPYSTGFEIECSPIRDYTKEYREYFKRIPDIMEVNCDNNEQRFRIPNGIAGIICLFNICEALPKHLTQSESGIHYHVDATECFEQIILPHTTNHWILDELDSWDFVGTFNSRAINSGWLRFNSLRTLEFRCGNMSFEYPHLVKRIVHANDIVRRLKEQVGFFPTISDAVPDLSQAIEYVKNDTNSTIEDELKSKIEKLQKQLQNIKDIEEELKSKQEQEEKEERITMDEIRQVINRRVRNGS